MPTDMSYVFSGAFSPPICKFIEQVSTYICILYVNTFINFGHFLLNILTQNTTTIFIFARYLAEKVQQVLKTS